MGGLDGVTGEVVRTAYRLHTDLGPGMMETVYELVLARMLEEKGFKVERQKDMPFTYSGIHFVAGFRADLLVEDQILVEVKAAGRPIPAHERQLMTYLRLLDLRVGFVIDFGLSRLNDGLRRVVNRHLPSPDSPLRVNRRDAASAVAAPYPPAVPPRTSAPPASSA